MNSRLAILALRAIVAARDYHAECGQYPPPPLGPNDSQCFDDWAADLALAPLLAPCLTGSNRAVRFETTIPFDETEAPDLSRALDALHEALDGGLAPELEALDIELTANQRESMLESAAVEWVSHEQ